MRVGPLDDSSLAARSIGQLQLINVASPSYLARHGMPLTPANLNDHCAVNYASPSTGRVEPWEWMHGGTRYEMDVKSRVTVNGAEAYIACCLSGLGLIQIPEYDVRDLLAAGELVEVMPD